MEAQEILEGPNGVTFMYNPGRIDPKHEAWTESRKPLTAVFEFNNEKIFVINNHLKSKVDSTVLFGTLQPSSNGGVHQRLKQTAHINEFVNELKTADPDAKIIVLGDFNDLQMTPPLVQITEQGVLVELMDALLVDEERYTYNFDGNCQAIDHIFVTKNLLHGAAVQPVHVNTWFPDKQKGSDHDPLVAKMSFCKKVRTSRFSGQHY